MEFDLKQIQREWIEGVSEAAFLKIFDATRARLEAAPEVARSRGLLLCERDPVAFSATFFAAVSIRFPVVLANPDWGAREWAAFAGLVTPAIRVGAGRNDRAVLSAADSAVGSGSRSERSVRLEPGSILIPTGGTTGGVKLAVHDWRSLAAACEGVQRFLGGGAIDSCCVLPLYHVSGLMQLLRAYHSGGRIRFDVDDMAGKCLSYVPTQLHRALADPKRIAELSKARALFVGGAGLVEGLADKARALRLPVVPVYGMTETAAMVAAIPSQDFLTDPGAGAIALGGARFWIETGGRIRIQSPALFRGYQGQKAVDLSGGYLTDDEGYLDASERLHVIGRIDRLMNSGGEKIDPREVEAAFCQLRGVEEALAVGVPDSEWGQRLSVFYTGRPVKNWKEALKKKLAPHKIPKEAHFRNALPLEAKVKFLENR